MKIEVKSSDQLLLMRRAGLVVADALQAMTAAAVPGVTTGEIDQVGRRVLADAGATSSFLGYAPGFGVPAYPAAACISTNDEVVHGIPGTRVLADGDLVSIDFGAIVSGWHGDAAVTVEVGDVSDELHTLSQVTHEALWRGIAQVRPGAAIGDISAAIAASIRSQPGRYGIVADYTGHGIGTQMHMEPDVPNTGRRGRGPTLVPGMAIAIEPMVTLGKPVTEILDDDWTVSTADGQAAAHWEHTVAITANGAWVLTARDGGEELLAQYGGVFAPLRD